MFEDMNKVINILLAIALTLLFTTGLAISFGGAIFGTIWFAGIVTCTLISLIISLGKTFGFIKDKQ